MSVMDTCDAEGFPIVGNDMELMRQALTAAADKFRDYEMQHLAKQTPEADAKAAVNRQMADLCLAALGRYTAPAAVPGGVYTLRSRREADALAVHLERGDPDALLSIDGFRVTGRELHGIVSHAVRHMLPGTH